MSLDVSKYASKSFIPRYKKSERRIGSKITLAKPRIYEQVPFQNFPKQKKDLLEDNISVIFPRLTDLPRLATTKEEIDINQNSKKDLVSLSIITIMNLASGKVISKYDLETTILYLR